MRRADFMRTFTTASSHPEKRLKRVNYMSDIKKKFRWIRDDIEINFPLPEICRNIIKDLERFDLEENYAYDNLAETLDHVAKELYAEGVLTKKQWETLCAKYEEVW